MVLYSVTLTDLHNKHVAQVCQHQLSFLFYPMNRINKNSLSQECAGDWPDY